MSRAEKISLVALRLTLGWLFLYAGVSHVFTPNWSAEGYLKGAKTAVWFFQLLLHPNVLPTINFITEWSLVLLGISLILGLFVRLSSILGSALMFLFYLPVLSFPYVGHSVLVDEHIVYIAGLAVLAVFRAGRVWGLETKYLKLPDWLG